MKKTLIYISIFVAGAALAVTAILLKKSFAQTFLLSLGTGLIASSLTAGFIDLSNYIDFSKKRKYRRSIELCHLSFEMLSLARLITGKHESKDINVLINLLSDYEITEVKEDYVISCINSQRTRIEQELNAIREVQDYLSLSGFFTDKEIAFLCRSINFYNKTTGKENIKFVIDNIVSYLEMFIDTY